MTALGSSSRATPAGRTFIAEPVLQREASTSSVGTMAIARFLRPVCYQNLPFPL